MGKAMAQRNSVIDLSIILPGIRPHKWLKLYESIVASFSGAFELIFIGPENSNDLIKFPNVRFIKDYGSPMRASQIGAVTAQGKILTWAADDCLYEKGSLDKAYGKIIGTEYKNVVTGKYTEGENPADWKIQLSYDYQRINFSYPKTKYVEDHWLIFNVALMHNQYFRELGGWDCQFEACPIGHTDLAVRAQRNRSQVFLLDDKILSCEHMPARSGDHGPVHDAHVEHDEPIYKDIYGSAACLDRISIDLENWRRAPAQWKRRFQ